MRSHPPFRTVDVVVIGGGPAGATAAALLASWNRSVVLVHHEPDRPSLAESLPWSTRKLLRFLGQLDVVDAARFHPNFGNISRWAGKDATAATDDPGYHISRRAFDRVLRDHACSQGASIVVGHVTRVDPGSAVSVEHTGSQGARSYTPRFVLDCSGRAGVVARRGLRRTDVGYRTLAIAAEWECPDWPAGERSHTFVDSYENGWAWSVPLSSTRRQCTVMVDADLTTIRKATLAALYRAELRKAISIDARLAGSRQLSKPWACDASLYRCARAADSGALLVGDAASFIEPLSSAGVKKALASAWRAAVVVNTALNKPEMLGVACDFHDRREREVYEDCLRRSAAFFKSAAAVYDDRFWAVRANARDDSGNGSPSGLTDVDLGRDQAVRRAFETLRDRPSLGLKPSPHLTLGRAAVVEDREIVLRDAVVIPGFDEPVRFAAGVNLPELIRIAAGSRDVASLIGTYHARVAAIDPRSLLVGLSFLVARELMVRDAKNNFDTKDTKDTKVNIL